MVQVRPVRGNGVLNREQRLLSLALWGTMCIIVLVVNLLANFSPLTRRYIASELARQRDMNGVYPYTGGWVDPIDYLFLDQIPKADYSRGGVYFVGASNTMISIMPWQLPPAERKLIHNYAIGGLGHREARHFLRYLVDKHDLLQAGGDRTTVFLGLFYGMASNRSVQFDRYGLYNFDSQGIHDVPMSSFERLLRIQEIYVNRFLHNVILPASDVRSHKGVSPAAHRAKWIEVMGDDWREGMPKQMHELELLLDYLQEQKVRVRVLLVPQATWHDGLPFAQAYVEMLKPILEKHGVPMIDFRRFLPDEDFGDATHFNYTGQWKVHRVYRELALQALSEMGTLPP